jgi:hypothetical protein
LNAHIHRSLRRSLERLLPSHQSLIRAVIDRRTFAHGRARQSRMRAKNQPCARGNTMTKGGLRACVLLDHRVWMLSDDRPDRPMQNRANEATRSLMGRRENRANEAAGVSIAPKSRERSHGGSRRPSKNRANEATAARMASKGDETRETKTEKTKPSARMTDDGRPAIASRTGSTNS